MKSPLSEHTVEMSGNPSCSLFMLKEENTAHILGILRNQLYSDKTRAIIREYSTNALDAHRIAGKEDQPISINLPGHMDPTLRVRDYGYGLSEKEIRDVYCSYGESTKRDSNLLIGQLGIGAKSAFCYTDQFLIVSYYQGIRNTYSAFIDESDMGMIALLNSEPSSEPSGIEVQIAIRTDDFNEVTNKAYQCTTDFKVLPLINGSQDRPHSVLLPAISYGGTGWRIRQGGRGAVAIMGDTAYPLRNTNLPLALQSLLVDGLEVDFALGDIAMQASREELEYNQRTNNVLKERLEDIRTQLGNMITDIEDNAFTWLDLALAHYRHSLVLKILARELKSNHPANSNIPLRITNNWVQLEHYDTTCLYTRNRSKECGYTTERKSSKLVACDSLIYEVPAGTKRIKARILRLLEDNPTKQIQTISFYDDSSRTASLPKLGPIPALDTVEPLVLIRARHSTQSSHTVLRAQVFDHYLSDARDFDPSKGSGYYHTLPTGEEFRTQNWQHVRSLFNLDKIVFIRPSRRKAFEGYPLWQDLSAAILELMRSILSNPLAREAYNHCQSGYRGVLTQDAILRRLLEVIPSDSPFTQVLEAYLAIHPLHNMPRMVLAQYRDTHHPTIPPTTPLKTLLKQYPMLGYMDSYLKDPSEGLINAITSYIAGVDRDLVSAQLVTC